MNDGQITFSTALDNKELEKEYAAEVRKIESINDKLEQKRAERAPVADRSASIGAELDAAKAQLDYMQSGAEVFSSDDIAEQQARVKGLQAEWNSVQAQVERYDQQISNASIELSRNEEKAGALAGELNAAGTSTNRMSEATNSASKHMSMFESMLERTIIRATSIVFIYKAIEAVITYIKKAMEVTPQAAQAIAQLKGAFLTMVQPLIGVIIPALTAFIRVLTGIITVIARFTSMIFGTTIQASEASAKSLNNQIGALDGVSAAAKKATKSLAPFDEIEQLTASDAGGGAGGGKFGGIKPDFSGLDETEKYKEKIDKLTIYISGALLALGVILTFSGANIPLGLGLIALGAVGLAAEIAENWGSMDSKVGTVLTNVLLALGAAGMVIGAILAFSGANIPLGIGLMIMGAASLGTAAVLNWDTIRNKLRDTSFAGIVVAIGAALIVIGAVLAFTGVALGLGIGLMVAGAAALGTEAALNWDTIKQKLQDTSFAGIIVAIGAALIVIGAVLTFTGVAMPLGIGLMLAGAAALGAEAVLNWDAIKEKLRDSSFAGIVTAIGAALLVIGAVFCFTGVAMPLGIGLMLAGGATLGTEAVLNWDAILDKLKEAWQKIVDWWNTDIAPIFTKEWWEDKFESIHIAFENKIRDAVNAGVALFNRFIDWVNAKLSITWPSVTLPDGSTLGGGSFQLFTIPHIPPLATGAVIPPNKEFLALLGDQKSGTNIEAPEELIRRIVREESGSKGPNSITVIMEYDRREFGRVIYDLNNETTQRVGVRLAT